MRTPATALILAPALSLTAVFSIVPATAIAAADTPGCVTQREYQHAHVGDRATDVAHIFDTIGRFRSETRTTHTRDYRFCPRARRDAHDRRFFVRWEDRGNGFLDAKWCGTLLQHRRCFRR